MDRFRRTAGRHPLVTALASVAVTLVAMGVGAAVTAAVTGRDIADPAVQVGGQVAGVVLVLVVLARSGWLRAAGVTDPGDRRLWGVTALVLLYTGICALLAFFGTVAVDLSVDGAAVPSLLHTTLAGVVEELLFRGLVLWVLVAGWGRTRRGVVAAVVLSAVLFGASHLANLATGAVDVTLLQAAEAALSAVLYGALVVAGGSLWPAVALHSLVNLLVVAAAENAPGFEVTVGDYVAFIVLQLPVFAYAVHLVATAPGPRDPADRDAHDPSGAARLATPSTSGAPPRR